MQASLRMLLAAALGTSVGACFDDDLTLNTECINGDDCGPGQVCKGTPYQDANGLNSWCRPSNECAAGEQPGCKCDAGECVSSFDGLTLIEVREECILLEGMDLEDCMVEESTLSDCFCIIAPTA